MPQPQAQQQVLHPAHVRNEPWLRSITKRPRRPSTDATAPETTAISSICEICCALQCAPLLVEITGDVLELAAEGGDGFVLRWQCAVTEVAI